LNIFFNQIGEKKKGGTDFALKNIKEIIELFHLRDVNNKRK